MVRSIRAALLAVALLATVAAPTFAAAPGNDDIATPEVIAAIPYANAQDTTEATADPGDPDCFGTGPTVWYAYTPADDGWLSADTFGSDYDTTLTVVTSGGDFVGCNDDSGGLQSRLVFEAAAGTTYLLMVASYGGGAGGSLVFHLDATDPPVQLELTATLDPNGRFLKDGTAVIGVTVTCNLDAFGYIGLEVRQQVGRFTIRGWADVGFDCGPEPTTLLLSVQGENGKFAGGNAAVVGFAEAYAPDKDTYAGVEISGSVRLRK